MELNKKTRTIIFIASAVLFNVLIFFGVFLVMMSLYIFIVSRFIIHDEGLFSFTTPVLILAFAASIAVSFFVYRAALKFISGKIDLESYFSSGQRRTDPRL